VTSGGIFLLALFTAGNHLKGLPEEGDSKGGKRD
jgi:hypothetical protein